ncbi:MAG: hypothetical protein DBY04_03550 [Clostridiales bacterium]|nr:MAG: hypothetical protein DBY04_03550 [Clostridiales bacterium]
MWLKEGYEIYLKRDNKAYLYNVKNINGRFESNWFQIIPYSVAAIIKLVSEGYTVENIVSNLIERGVQREKAEKLIEAVLTKYNFIFTDIPQENKYEKGVLENLTHQFGEMPFDYRKKKYSFPKNVVIEVYNEETGYIKADVAQRIHSDCYAGGTEKIFYNGTNVHKWQLIMPFIRENKKNNISTIIKLDSIEDYSDIDSIIQSGVTKIQFYHKKNTIKSIENLRKLLEAEVELDLFLENVEFYDLLRFPIKEFAYRFNKIYVINTTQPEECEKTKLYLMKCGAEPIIITGCKNTSFGERSCFKSGVMNLVFSAEGKAIFCITGGRNIVLGDANFESIVDIWNRFDANLENRKRLFAMCKNV